MRNKSEPSTLHLSKITAFITRTVADSRLMLVLRHSTGGMRLLDGIVQRDEAPEQAAQREIQMQTGIDTVHLTPLAVVDQTFEPDVRVVSQTTMLMSEPERDATLIRFNLDAGTQVRVLDERDGFNQVVYEEYTPRQGQLALMARRAGWVPMSVLAQRVEQHLYHLHLETDPPAPKGGIQLYWVPMQHDPGLPAAQAELLAQIRDRLAP